MNRSGLVTEPIIMAFYPFSRSSGNSCNLMQTAVLLERYGAKVCIVDAHEEAKITYQLLAESFVNLDQGSIEDGADVFWKRTNLPKEDPERIWSFKDLSTTRHTFYAHGLDQEENVDHIASQFKLTHVPGHKSLVLLEHHSHLKDLGKKRKRQKKRSS